MTITSYTSLIELAYDIFDLQPYKQQREELKYVGYKCRPKQETKEEERGRDMALRDEKEYSIQEEAITTGNGTSSAIFPFPPA
jgi:hypothetical protein